MRLGPLHERRFEILNELKAIPVQTGDIFYRQGDARGPLDLPFSALVCALTNSKFSHAAMLYIYHGEYFLLDINENGTQQLRFIDWVDSCVTKDLQVVRLKNLTNEKLAQIEVEIKNILEEDPDYDYSFVDPNKYYCTESVNYIAEKVGLPICKPEPIKKIIPWWAYPGFWLCNKIFKFLTGKGLPLHVDFYYIGNEKKGMMASETTEVIYKI